MTDPNSCVERTHWNATNHFLPFDRPPPRGAADRAREAAARALPALAEERELLARAGDRELLARAEDRALLARAGAAERALLARAEERALLARAGAADRALLARAEERALLARLGDLTEGAGRLAAEGAFERCIVEYAFRRSM